MVWCNINKISTYWTLCGLIRAAKKKMIQNILVRKELGNFPALLYSWGLIITFEIIMNSLIGRVIYVFFKNKDTYPTFDNYENEEWD